MNLRTSIYVTLALTLATVPLAAQGRGKGHVAATSVIHAKPQSATKVVTHPATPAPKSAVAPRTQGGGTPPKPAKPPKPAAATGQGAKPHPHSASQRPAKPVTVQQHLAKQPQLSAKLATLLPGMNVSQAATGFKNLGAFVSAVHVSRNLGIPFLTLKSRLAGPNPQSLGQAIQALKPGVNVENEVQRARTQTRGDLKNENEKH